MLTRHVELLSDGGLSSGGQAPPCKLPWGDMRKLPDVAVEFSPFSPKVQPASPCMPGDIGSPTNEDMVSFYGAFQRVRFKEKW